MQAGEKVLQLPVRDYSSEVRSEHIKYLEAFSKVAIAHDSLTLSCAIMCIV